MFFIVEGTSTEKEKTHGLVFSPFKIGHCEASSLTSLNVLAIFTKQIVSKLHWWIVLIIDGYCVSSLIIDGYWLLLIIDYWWLFTLIIYCIDGYYILIIMTIVCHHYILMTRPIVFFFAKQKLSWHHLRITGKIPTTTPLEKPNGTLLNAPEFTQIVGPEKC